VVDRAALEMRSTRKRTGGSNPSLSARSVTKLIDIFIFLAGCAGKKRPFRRSMLGGGDRRAAIWSAPPDVAWALNAAERERSVQAWPL
jgi:hypothetical protein